MRTLSHFETLLYYDGPELFVAQDQLGGCYVCVLVDIGENIDKYLCVPISSGRLDRLIIGDIDLRSIFTSPEIQEEFEGEVIDGNLNQIIIHPLQIDEIPTEWLPEAELFLKLEEFTDNKVVQEALSKQRGIIDITLNPPEALQEPKITADHLSEAMRLFQRLMKFLYRKAIQLYKTGDKYVKESISSPSNYQLEVFGFSPGSFTLHMQTASKVDLLGNANISRALDILDSVNYEIDDPQHAVELISEYKGHFATAYKDLLNFIIETDTPFSYEWSMPSIKETRKAQITPRQAKPLYEAIIKKVDIGKEEKKLTGRFKKVDEDRGTWRLLSETDQIQYSGVSEINLAGIVIDTQKYELFCEEQLEIAEISGKESTKLHLVSFKTV